MTVEAGGRHADYRPLLEPFLAALGWRGTAAQLAAALPSGGGPLDLADFRGVLSNIGLCSVLIKRPAGNVPADLFPLLEVGRHGPVLHATPAESANIPAGGLFLRAGMTDDEPPPATLRQTLRRFGPLLREITLMSLIIGVVALAPIPFNRILYDHVIASDTTLGFGVLVGGVLLALLAELILRQQRNEQLARFGGRLDHFVSCSVFERLLFLPPAYTERASVSAQLARLRDFENVREFFTGPLATLFFEMPLVCIYLLAMAVLTQWLALVPLFLALCYVVLILVVNSRLREYGRATAAASSLKQEFLLETVTKLRALRLAGMEDAWLERYRQMSSRAGEAAFKAGFAAQSFETASYVLMMLGAIATLGFGVLAAIAGDLSTGSLVAGMMIIWRIIAPLQIACASITRLQQLGAGGAQVQRLLNLPPEHDPRGAPPAPPRLRGHVLFNRVTLRYTQESEPALLGLSFEARPGQIIAIRGRNGSGKSTILKMILGLYPPQSGTLRIDGLDIRQFDPVALRQAITYIPQSTDFFPGSILENLSLANPAADAATIARALDDAQATEDIAALPQGLQARLEATGAAALTHTLRQRLNLARAYLRPAPIVLLDEASYSLGRENDAAFARHLQGWRGKSTVIMVTHREDHMRLADILLVIDKGELTHAGPPDQVLNALKGRKS